MHKLKRIEKIAKIPRNTKQALKSNKQEDQTF